MSYDDYSIICQTCGRHRGAHYSDGGNSPIIFCRQEDLKHYTTTGIVEGGRFVPVNKKYKYKPKIIGDIRVVMNTADGWAKAGQIGTVINRDEDTARIQWDSGPRYRHHIDNLSLLSESKDPNLLFLIRKSINE